MPMQKIPTTLLSFFWHFAKKQWKLLLIMQIASLGWTLDATLWPCVIEMLIDKITTYIGDRSDTWQYLATPLWLGATLWITVECSYRIAGILSTKFFPRFEAAVRTSMFDYIQHHSYTYFSNNFAGSIANKISDMVQGLSALVRMVVYLFIPVCLAIIVSITLFLRINPLFALILLTWIILHVGVCIIGGKRCDYYADIHSETRSTLSGKIVDSLTNNMNVKLFARTKHENSLLSTSQQEEFKTNTQSLWYIEKLKIVLGILSFLGPGVALNWYMLSMWQQGQLTAGEIIFIFNSTWNITMMAWMAGLQMPDFFKEMGRCKQALRLIRDTHDIQDVPDAKQLTVPRGEITFEKVTFNYSGKYTLFEDKTITLKAGTKVGLVGFSGAGKSTFVNLILRFFDTDKGRILIDGQDISKVTQESLRAHIAMIPQDASLFHRTLIENIRYGKVDATLEEVMDAAKKAHCQEFIDRLPHGYQTEVGERGTKLSGGQRQRIALARAILKNAPILILDEATSALDSVTEKYIQDSLKYLMEGRTTIVIAHRLSTLSDMDRILVFNEGEVIEDGTHNELIAAGGHYARLWEMQAEGFLPE
ncbi:MAG: putative transporter ATP-binding protein [Chlamydiia bacterium]|nr:putative transporter ATP-binding protein [Chlamydiia bacterium]